MRMEKVFVGMMLAGIAAMWAQAANFTIAADRMAEVDGKRVFILGLYENPKDDAVLRQAAEAGFNLVYAGADTAALDRLEANGVWAWINTGANIDWSEDRENRKQALEAMARDYGKHPALLVWEVPDEALWNCWYGAQGWRQGQERAQQKALIEGLADKDLAAQLREQLAKIGTLYQEGRYADGEQLADDLWIKLGKTQPKPGYGLGTAPERAAAMSGGMMQGYAALRKLDPAHPVWMNHAPRNQVAQLAAFNQAADIAGCDIYPVPFNPKVGHSDLTEKTVAAAGAYTTRMQEAAPGKPVWMVLQGFGWGDIQPERSEADRKELRRPTLAETRFMAYDSIVRGARGILYWGTAYIEKDSALWKDLLTLAGELRDLQPVLSSPDAVLPLTITLAETFGSVDRSVQVLAKNVAGKTWFIAVNEWESGLTYTVHGLESLENKTFGVLQADTRAAVERGALQLSIPGRSVQVLCQE